MVKDHVQSDMEEEGRCVCSGYHRHSNNQSTSKLSELKKARIPDDAWNNAGH